MDLVIGPAGDARAVFSEAIDLDALGPLRIVRASHVEPTPDGRRTADMRPVLGPVLGPFARRSAALEAEHTWPHEHWLLPHP